MNKKKKYAYYVVELSYPIRRDEKFLCVPASWINDVTDNTALVYYPRCEPELIETLQIDPHEDNPLNWKMLITQVKHKSNSYRYAINYTKFLNTKSTQRLRQIQVAKKSQEQTIKDNEQLTSVENSSKSTQNPLMNFEKHIETFESLTAGYPPLAGSISEINENHSCEEENWICGIASSSIRSPNNLTEQTVSLSQLSNEKQLPYTSATLHHQNTLARNIYDESSDNDIEKSIKYKRVKKLKTNNDSHYHYTPELTNTPLKLKIIRKPTSPRIPMTEALTEPPANPNMGSVKKQAATAANDLNSLENSCQELRKHLTKTMHDLSLREHHQNTQMPGINEVNSEQNSESCEINEPMQYNLPEFTSISTCDPIILLEFTKINSRLDELFFRMNQNRCDITKVNSKIEEIAKERDCFYIQPTDPFSSKTSAREVEYAKSNKTVAPKRANSSGTKTLVKRKRNKSEGDQLEDIPKKTFTLNSAMPPEYNQYDSRWTLRYQKMDKGLIELVEKSNVYVNETNLLNYKMSAKSSRQLARMLLLEIFNLKALFTCTLTGAKDKPGLDKTATYYMLVYVEMHARQKNWAILCTDQEIANHRYHVMISLRSKIVNLRRSKFC